MLKKPGLGKNIASLGLKELLSELNANAERSAVPQNTFLHKLPIELMHPGKYQPRKSFDQEALEELASSIRAQGLLQPIIVRKSQDSNYEIIAGERRWRAAQLAELREVPVTLLALNDEQALAVSLIENIQRENLNVIDEALALKRLHDDFGLTHQQVAEIVGKSRASITNILRLLNLTEEVKALVLEGKLEMGHARALLPLSPLQQNSAAQTVANKGLSVRETERLVANLQVEKETKEKVSCDPNVLRLARALSDKIGAKVTIKQACGNKGQIVIHYSSLDELDGILERINAPCPAF